MIGSGNLVHNLHTYAWGGHPVEPFDWALRFERARVSSCSPASTDRWSTTRRSGATRRLSVPTPEHYLPLLYVMGARREGEPVSFPVEGIDGGSVSMLTVRVG